MITILTVDLVLRCLLQTQITYAQNKLVKILNEYLMGTKDI
jgi:hypothetical protein